MQSERAVLLKKTLLETVDRELPNLYAIVDDSAAISPRPGAWSLKQELGHLIDSATNNHLRFVRAAIEKEFRGPLYAQDDWVGIHGYQDAEWSMLIRSWYQANTLLAHLTGNLPDESLIAECTIGNDPAVTLDLLIDDYILHMKHHLDHILGRDPVTPYPRAV